MIIKINGGDGTGLYGAISWARLENMFREIGEIKQDERLTGVNVSENRLVYIVDKK